MQYTGHYASPLGGMLLAADDTGLTGLWFEGQKHFARGLDDAHEERSLPLFDEAKRWLDVYFSGREPDRLPLLRYARTPFQTAVCELLLAIPYGQTTTYGALAAALARQTGRAHISAQAVGGAVGHNPISLMIPCHRVVGANGSLTGYAGGLTRKERLLALERAASFPVPAPLR